MRWSRVLALLGKEMAGYRRQIAGDRAVLLWASGAVVLLGATWTPIILGEYWIESLALLVVYPIIATVIGIHGCLDAFAGERERHTLETLLASPIRESELIAGKLLGTVLIAFVLGLGPVLIGVVALSVAAGRVLLPAAHVLWGLPSFTLAFSLAMASGALFISLMSASVRHATQVFGYVLGGLLIVVPVLAVSLPDEIVGPLGQWLRSHPASRVLLVVDLALAAVAALALAHLHVYVRRGRPELL